MTKYFEFLFSAERVKCGGQSFILVDSRNAGRGSILLGLAAILGTPSFSLVPQIIPKNGI